MLSYVNVFSKDIVKLSGFHRDVFGFEEIAEIRSPIFVGLRAGPCCLGFNAQDAYELLNSGTRQTYDGSKQPWRR